MHMEGNFNAGMQDVVWPLVVDIRGFEGQGWASAFWTVLPHGTAIILDFGALYTQGGSWAPSPPFMATLSPSLQYVCVSSVLVFLCFVFQPLDLRNTLETFQNAKDELKSMQSEVNCGKVSNTCLCCCLETIVL